MTVAAGLFVPSPSVWWARGDGASSLRATAVAATTPSSTEVADPTPWRVDPAAPMPDLRWWASWPCGAALAAMVVLGCAAHPWRCDGLTVVSVAVGGVACARGWCGGALARRWWWWWWCSSVGPAMAGSDSRSEVAEGARQLAAALGGGVGAGWRLLLAVLVLAGVYSGRNSGGGGGSGYRIWRSGGRIRPSLGRIWCSCGGSDYRRWCSAGHRRRFCQGGGSAAWWFDWAASLASGRQSNGGGVVPSAMPWWRGRPWRWQACGAVVVLPALPGPVEATLPCWGLPTRVPVRAQGAAAGFPPSLLALSFFSMVAILWRWLGFMPALGGGPSMPFFPT